MFTKMSDVVQKILPLPVTALNKSLFTKKVLCPCLVVKNTQQMSKILPWVKFYMLKALHFKHVVEEGNCATVYLDPTLIEKAKFDINKFIKDQENKFDLETKSVEVTLTYDNLTIEETFDKLFPEDMSLSGFSRIGHIAHVNLKENFLEYKYLIGQVLLEKAPGCRTVVNKCENIENEFRNLPFELLAGEDNYVTKVHENGLMFELDFSKVFWNSRLATEHQRLIGKFAKRDLIYDVFAGVGPFAVAAAVKKKCYVVANDLNPDCTMYLEKNVRLNKAKDVDVHNVDGRVFLEDIVPKDLSKRIKEETISKGVHQVHFVMNLPAIAIDFLRYFVGIFNKPIDLETKLNSTNVPDCFIHCYSFSKNADDDVVATEEKVEKAFEGRKVNELNVQFVRNVAPFKNMMRASFKLTNDIMFDGKNSSS